MEQVSAEVSEFITKLDHPLKDVIEKIRQLILAADPEIAEHIKWNSPAFYYTGEMAPFDSKEYKRDLIVFHLRKKDQVLLVFPTGAKIDDAIGILEGKYTDGRRMVTIKSTEELESKKDALQQIIKQWLQLIEK
jgi:hypothetical protein